MEGEKNGRDKDRGGKEAGWESKERRVEGKKEGKIKEKKGKELNGVRMKKRGGERREEGRT